MAWLSSGNPVWLPLLCFVELKGDWFAAIGCLPAGSGWRISELACCGAGLLVPALRSGIDGEASIAGAELFAGLLACSVSAEARGNAVLGC